MKTMKINYYVGFLAVTLGLFLAAGQANAGTIVPDRDTLNALFVASPVTENFEGLPISDGTATNSSIWNENTLDASTTILIDTTTYGPGLVSSDVSFKAGDEGHMRWNGNNWFGLPSLTRTIVADGTNRITIDFSVNVTAFGVDLINYAPTLFGSRDDTVTVTKFRSQARIMELTNGAPFWTMSHLAPPFPSRALRGFWAQGWFALWDSGKRGVKNRPCNQEVFKEGLYFLISFT